MTFYLHTVKTARYRLCILNKMRQRLCPFQLCSLLCKKNSSISSLTGKNTSTQSIWGKPQHESGFSWIVLFLRLSSAGHLNGYLWIFGYLDVILDIWIMSAQGHSRIAGKWSSYAATGRQTAAQCSYLKRRQTKVNNLISTSGPNSTGSKVTHPGRSSGNPRPWDANTGSGKSQFGVLVGFVLKIR